MMQTWSPDPGTPAGDHFEPSVQLPSTAAAQVLSQPAPAARAGEPPQASRRTAPARAPNSETETRILRMVMFLQPCPTATASLQGQRSRFSGPPSVGRRMPARPAESLAPRQPAWCRGVPAPTCIRRRWIDPWRCRRNDPREVGHATTRPALGMPGASRAAVYMWARSSTASRGRPRLAPTAALLQPIRDLVGELEAEATAVEAPPPIRRSMPPRIRVADVLGGCAAGGRGAPDRLIPRVGASRRGLSRGCSTPGCTRPRTGRGRSCPRASPGGCRPAGSCGSSCCCGSGWSSRRSASWGTWR